MISLRTNKISQYCLTNFYGSNDLNDFTDYGVFVQLSFFFYLKYINPAKVKQLFCVSVA